MKILATLGDSLIVGIDGRLSLIGPRFRCHGYQNCCMCPECQPRQTRRELKKEAAMAPKACSGYTSHCQCPQCQAKERYFMGLRTARDAQKAAKCECGGTILGKEDTCFKCGKAVARAA